MFKSLSYLLCVIMLSHSCGHDNKTIVRKEYDILLPASISMRGYTEIGFACYEHGGMSEIVGKFTTILKAEEYIELRKKLFSSNAGEIYLATFSIQILSEQGVLKLSNKEIKQIEKNRMKNDSLSICSGCTYFENTTVKNLLSDKENFVYKEAKYWLDRIIKKSY